MINNRFEKEDLDWLSDAQDAREREKWRHVRHVIKLLDDVAMPERGDVYERMHAAIMLAIGASDDGRNTRRTAKDSSRSSAQERSGERQDRQEFLPK